jgi:hypothetical protein
VARHWEDTLRVIASIHTGAVREHDVIRMPSRDGHTPIQLGALAAHYGPIGTTLHVLRTADDMDYPRMTTLCKHPQGYSLKFPS